MENFNQIFTLLAENGSIGLNLDILETGVSGMAVSDEISADFNSIKIYNQLLNASSTVEQRYTFK